MAQGDILLTVTDVRGESKDRTVVNAIDLTGWSFSGNAPFDLNTGQSTGRVRLGELVVVKSVDISSPILIQFMVNNKLIDDVKLYCRKAGGDKQMSYYRIELKKARVRAVVQKCTSVGSTTVEETVSFGYQEITWEHAEQGAQGFLLGGGVAFSHQLDTNT